jgi:putative Mn2+ efflux pump MntP
MNSIQIFILSLAIALNSLITYLVAGYTLKDEKLIIKFRFAAIMLLLQILLIGTGLWLGSRISVLAMESNFYIAFGILLIMGLKTIFDSIRTKPEEKSYDLTQVRNVVMLSIAEGITPLIISIAAGLTTEKIISSWFIFVIIQFLAIFTGIVLGSRYEARSLKLRTGPIGGLIILAASLKLLIDLIGYSY